MPQKRYLEAGRVVATQGLDGAVRVQPWCDGPEFLTRFSRFYFDGAGRTARAVAQARVQKNVTVIHFEGISTIDEAKLLLRAVIYIDRQDVELPAGSYFEQDFIGLSVQDAQTGRVYGTLTEVLRTGANDVYAVKDAAGKETLIPAIRQVIAAVDVEEGVMRITPLKGLFDDAD